MIIQRDLGTKLKTLAHQFPAVAILGPRQSGKTTLATITFPDYEYFSFEDPAIRELVQVDPHAFLNKYKDVQGIILDEIQNVPELFSYLQVHIDKYKKRGHFILTGSHNLLLNQSISQSLAGRIAIQTLLPLSIHELEQARLLPNTIDHAMLRGFYPIAYTQTESSVDWYRSYINTYIERDVRQIKNVTNLSFFQKFMKLCAGRAGQILNVTSLSNDLGMSAHAVREWLSVLEASYIIFLLQPYYRNFNKRIIKSPKLYFYDTGLLCSLLSITNVDQLYTHYLKGNIFESMVIADFYKQRFNKGLNPDCYFWRDKSDYEIDCIIEKADKLIPVEIKLSESFNKNFLEHLTKWNKVSDTSPVDNILIYGGAMNQNTAEGKLVSWRSIGDLI